MRPPRAHLFLCVVLLTLATLASPAEATFRTPDVVDAFWGTEDTRSDVSPGDVGRPLTVTFRNADDDPVSGLEAELHLPRGLQPTFTGADEASRSEAVAPGGLWSPTFTVDLGPELKVGDRLTIEGTIRMRETPAGATPGAVRGFGFEVELVVSGTTRLTVHAENLSVRAHDEETVRLVIRNEADNTARQLEVEVAPAAGSTLQVTHPSAPQTLGDLGPGNTTTFEARVLTPSTPGQGAIAVTLRFVDPAGQRVTRTQTIPLSIVAWPEGPLDVVLRTEAISAGRDDVLRFDLDNVRGETLTDVVARLTIDGGVVPPTVFPRGTSYERRIGTIESAANQTIEWPVTSATTAPETHSVLLTLIWRDPSGQQHMWDHPFGLLVTGAIQLVLSETCAGYDGTSDVVSASGTINNLGNHPALDAYVAFHRPGIEAHDRVELGDVEPNDPFYFELQEGRADAPNGPIELIFFWNDDRGTEVSQVFALASTETDCLRATAPRDDPGGIPGPGIALVLAVLGLVSWAARRRR